MWEQIKFYAVQYGLKKYAPMAVMGGLTALGTFMAAHAGQLEQYGVTYFQWPWTGRLVPSGPCILIELDTFKISAIALIATLGPVIMRMLQHHSTGTPVVPGGARATDPPAETPPQETK